MCPCAAVSMKQLPVISVSGLWSDRAEWAHAWVRGVINAHNYSAVDWSIWMTDRCLRNPHPPPSLHLANWNTRLTELELILAACFKIHFHLICLLESAPGINVRSFRCWITFSFHQVSPCFKQFGSGRVWYINFKYSSVIFIFQTTVQSEDVHEHHLKQQTRKLSSLLWQISKDTLKSCES